MFFPVLPSLIDRLGDAKDQVRDQDQVLLLKIMEQAASPQVYTHTRTHCSAADDVAAVLLLFVFMLIHCVCSDNKM